MLAKRLFDAVVAIIGLLLLAPFLAAVAIWIKLDSPGPALFQQVRVGRNGRHFRIKKFRTMHSGSADLGPAITASGDVRITRCGAILRKTKIDELPQLWNVLAGDMSLVGPRPEVPKYVAHYSDQERREILSLRPGITDPASLEFIDESQVLAGAADLEAEYLANVMPRKLQAGRRYVRERTFLRDVGIILRTLVRVMAREVSGS
ncbi:MAG: sugar transferase [Gammaproteobacteria bacterium]|nr:MAG: sugar transferase [Gammaproteobacteria bacterium]